MIVVDTLSFLTLLSLVAVAVYLIWEGFNWFSTRKLEDQITSFESLKRFLNDHSRKLAFLIALTATAGSLYFSNVLGWTPCRLCWFQRIMMYPLVVVLGVGLLLDKRDVADYVLPMSLIGISVSTFHYPLQRLAEIQAKGCSQAVTSCDMTYTAKFGFISIPLMAWTAFLLIIILLWKFPQD